MPTLSPSAASAGICTARKRGWEQSKVKASLTFKTMCVCMCAQLYPTLCRVTDCSPPGSSVHGISQARRLEWVAISSSRGSSWPRDWNHVSCVSCIGRWILYQLSHGGSPLSRLNNVKQSLEQGLPGCGKAGAHRAACNQRAHEKTKHQVALMLPRDHWLRSLSFPDGPPTTAAHLNSQIWTKTSGFSQRLLFLFILTVLSLSAAAKAGFFFFFFCLLHT